jgi:hypothetical protein
VSAEKQRRVVARLLGESVVSPQPPSVFWWADSHLTPDVRRASSAGSAARNSAVTAVAVESAEEDRWPSQ